MSLVQLCRQYTPALPLRKKTKKKNKQKNKKEKKNKRKKEKREKKEKEKNPLYSVVQDVGLGQQSEKTYRQEGEKG